MDTILFKYHGFGLDYLVYDICRNKTQLSKAGARAIFNKNCGIGSQGILMGNVRGGGQMDIRMLHPDGSEEMAYGNSRKVFGKYLEDAGYEKTPESAKTGTDISRIFEEQKSDIQMVGKIYVSEDYLAEN